MSQNEDEDMDIGREQILSSFSNTLTVTDQRMRLCMHLMINFMHTISFVGTCLYELCVFSNATAVTGAPLAIRPCNRVEARR